jgi:hypothetical protein
VIVLLDENLDHRLRTMLGKHEVVTVRYKGWMGLKNGELLQTAEEHGIQVFVTGDQSLSYEQNLTGQRLAIIVLSSIELPILRKNLPSIVSTIDMAIPGSFQSIDCGTFSRRRRGSD